MDELRPLLGTTLVLVAHPDDEVIVCGALMQTMRRAIVVFATDGAPRREGFWRQYGSRGAYADVRREEARQVLELAGACPIFLVDHVEGGIADQELFRNLPAAIAAVEKIIEQARPDCILAPAYEGGHPDHDAACFMASVAGRGATVPVWESPLYHCKADGSHAVQTFPHLTGQELTLQPTHEVLQKKVAMFDIYKSQGLVLEGFQPGFETFRPVSDYDFTRPPLPWKLNYERWRWTMSGNEVSAAFAAYLRGEARGCIEDSMR